MPKLTCLIFTRTVEAAVILGFLTLTAAAQTEYQPSPENLQARQEFQDAKFGMFIHWGVLGG